MKLTKSQLKELIKHSIIKMSEEEKEKSEPSAPEKEKPEPSAPEKEKPTTDISDNPFDDKESVEESKKIAKLKQESEDVRLLTYKILVDNFNDRYKNLDSHQKKLLREYINNLSNSNGLKEYIGKEVKRVKKQLIGLIKKVDDKVTAIKLKESTNQLDNLQLGNFVKDSQVLNLMRYYELVKELKKCVNPNSKK